MKKLKTIKLYEEFFFFGGQSPEYIQSIFERIVELLKRNGEVQDVSIDTKKENMEYLHLVYDDVFFSISIVDRNDVVVMVEKDGITDTLFQYPITEIDKIVNVIINYKK